jgi:hypothetical protein
MNCKNRRFLAEVAKNDHPMAEANVSPDLVSTHLIAKPEPAGLLQRAEESICDLRA